MRRRAKDLGIKKCLFGLEDKLSGCKKILEELKIAKESSAYIGDDNLDIEAIRSHGRVWKYKGTAFVGDKKMADAQWSATIVDRK